MATAQSRIAHALLIQFEFIHHKPVMMPEFHDDWDELAIMRASEKAEKMLGAKFNIRAFHDAVLELGSVPLPLSRRGSTASSLNMAKALTRIWSDWVSGVLGE